MVPSPYPFPSPNFIARGSKAPSESSTFHVIFPRFKIFLIVSLFGHGQSHFRRKLRKKFKFRFCLKKCEKTRIFYRIYAFHLIRFKNIEKTRKNYERLITTCKDLNHLPLMWEFTAISTRLSIAFYQLTLYDWCIMISLYLIFFIFQLFHVKKNLTERAQVSQGIMSTDYSLFHYLMHCWI
jgi:hypothetical protein